MSIINQIVNRLPSNYARHSPISLAGAYAPLFASNKQGAFLKRYYVDKTFKSKMNNLYAYSLGDWFDFLFPSNELKEYLEPEFQRAELLLIELDRASALKISDVSSALEIAENYEEFQRLVLKKYSAITNIWVELERKLEEKISL